MGFLTSRRKLAETAEKQTPPTPVAPPVKEEPIPVIEDEPMTEEREEPQTHDTQGQVTELDESTLLEILREHEQRMRNLEQKVMRIEAILSQRVV